MTFKVNAGRFKRVSKKLLRYVKLELPKDSFDEFKNNTPKDRGNARRNTKLSKTPRGFKITGDYPYSGVLDKGGFPNPPKAGTGKTSGGYSTQAPKGMSEPTIDFIKKELRRKIGRTT